MKILVLGAGAWGTAVAVSASRSEEGHRARHQVTLWARDEASAAVMQAGRVNTRYLPGIVLSENLVIQGGDAILECLMSQHDLIVLATPVSAARSLLLRLRDSLATLRSVAPRRTEGSRMPASSRSTPITTCATGAATVRRCAGSSRWA